MVTQDKKRELNVAPPFFNYSYQSGTKTLAALCLLMEIEIVAMVSELNKVLSTFRKEALLFSRIFPMGEKERFKSDSWFGL